MAVALWIRGRRRGRTNETGRVDLGNVIGMQGFNERRFGADTPTMRLGGVNNSLQYIGLRFFDRICSAYSSGNGRTRKSLVSAINASRSAMCHNRTLLASPRSRGNETAEMWSNL